MAKEFKVNYDGRKIRPDEVMVPFPYDELDAKENCVNRECIGRITLAGATFRVMYKAVPAEWARKALSSLTLIENEKLGHYTHKGTVSLDEMHEDFETDLESTPSAEDQIMEQLDLEDTLQTFRELVSSLIEKSPKLGYAVLLLHTNIHGQEFYSRMLLTRAPANKIQQKAKSILKEGLENLDISAVNTYRSRNDAVYRERAYQLLEEIVKKFP